MFGAIKFYFQSNNNNNNSNNNNNYNNNNNNNNKVGVLGSYITTAPLTPLDKPGGGVRPIAVDTMWCRLVSKVVALVVGKTLDAFSKIFSLRLAHKGAMKLFFILLTVLLNPREM